MKWKKIENSKYEVSDIGLVRLKTIDGYSYRNFDMTDHGYLRVSIDIGKKMVHRLVAFAFLERDENRPFVNHINACKTDNRLCNIEWCTADENNDHAVRNKLGTLPIEKVAYNSNCEVIGEYKSSKKAQVSLKGIKHVLITKSKVTDELVKKLVYDKFHADKSLTRKPSVGRYFTADQIREIRGKFKFRVYTTRMLGAEYGVTPSYITNIIKRRVYKNVL